MNIYYITRGKRDDIKVLSELLTELYLEIGDESGSQVCININLIIEMLESEKTELYVAKLADNTIVGFITLTECQAIYGGEKYGLINEMYVKPAFRSMSIGRKLVEKIIAVAKEKKWSRIDVTAQKETRWKRAVKFYENCGFTLAGPKLKYSI